MGTQGPTRRRRDRGDGTVAWDKVNKCYVGRISLGYNRDGTRNRPTVWGRTKTEVKKSSTSCARKSTQVSALRSITQLSCASRTGSTRSSVTRTRWKRSSARRRTGSIRR